MSSTSYRDRFFTPPVAPAVASPSGVLAASAVVGTGATAPVSIPFATVGGLVEEAVDLGGRVVAAARRSIDDRGGPSELARLQTVIEDLDQRHHRSTYLPELCAATEGPGRSQGLTEQ